MLLNDGCIDIGFSLKSWSKLSLENDTLNQSPCSSIIDVTSGHLEANQTT